MLEYLDIGNERLHETTARSLTSVTGLIGLPGIRAVVYDRPEDDGVVDPDRQFFAARTIVLEGETWGASIDAAWSDFAVIATQLEAALNTGLLLKWQHYAGSVQLQGYVRLADSILPELSAATSGPFIRYQATLRAADPRWYSQTQRTVAIGQPASGPASIVNGGNTLTYPRVTITGPIVNPAIVNSTQGKTVSFTTTISAGQTLIVDMLPSGRIAEKNGVSIIGALNWSASHFFGIGANATELVTYTGTSTTAATTMTIVTRDAYSV